MMNLVVYHGEKAEIEVQQIINHEVVDLSHNMLNHHKVKNAYPLIKEWNATKLQINDMDNKTILREISHIEFPQLKQLWVKKNEIDSIQGISRIWLPSIQKLSLSFNNPMNIREFRKMNCQRLTLIGLFNNRVFDGAQSISKIPSKFIDNLGIDTTENIQTIQDLSWVCKMESTKVSIIWILNNPLRLKEKKTKAAIRRKYENIEINEEW